MFCILSFQFILNFGNSCTYREASSHKTAVAAELAFATNTNGGLPMAGAFGATWKGGRQLP